MIPITQPFLPPQKEYEAYIQDVWQRNWLTNNGPLVNELELKLKNYLGLQHLLYTGNGTIALQIAIKALDLRGEIITTPFSYVATLNSIVWEGCRPVFADIERDTLNIDPEKIEAAITTETTGIIATHCFGNPCNVEAIETIAEKHNLRVIYDAAHCFGTEYKGESIYSRGDISTGSFHATKVYHTVEGGAVFTRKPELLKKMAYLRNFGHDGPEKFNGVGINGKNSEIHAAMGLCNLDYAHQLLQRRKEQSAYYNEILANLKCRKPDRLKEASVNHAYYPVIFDSEKLTLKMKRALEAKEIFPRRYFYPPLSTLEHVEKGNTPICEDLAGRILCLPMYHELSREEQDMIARILLRVQNYE